MKLTQLKNIGNRDAQWLKDIGILSVEDLAGKDTFELWKEMKRIHPKYVDLEVLLEIDGAVHNIDVKNLSEQRKHELAMKVKKWEISRHSETDTK